ncbi:hypothetical protein Hypma_014129 [Hypsizygus marmoreus]|uniref:Uncharacterized protein n=1 Tax=Hypsizygus marmoreus TaxID=39966 RepID=A0A369K8F4_HYPMA|nr:hypothetical protein Hypma_014129 [Hypsizygus marmoreus]
MGFPWAKFARNVLVAADIPDQLPIGGQSSAQHRLDPDRRLKAAMFATHWAFRKSSFANGPRSEHSSPPRLVLDEPGGNSPSGVPEIHLSCACLKILSFGAREDHARFGV